MRISTCAASSSSFVSPVRSAPNSTAAGRAARLDEHALGGSRTSTTRKFWSRVARRGGRDEAAASERLRDVSDHARLRAARRRRRRPAPSPRCAGTASVCTSTSSRSAMFFMARATAPMLPGCEGSTSTMRMSEESWRFAALCYPRRSAVAASAPPLTRAYPVHALLNIAVRAARRAGEVIVRSLNRLESPCTITSKGRNDFVSEVDQAAEEEIIAIIRKHYPKHAVPGRGERRAAATATPSGSSIRSMARPISCTASRRSRCPSPASSAASSSTPSSTTPCGRRSSPPRAVAARTSTTAASA